MKIIDKKKELLKFKEFLEKNWVKDKLFIDCWSYTIQLNKSCIFGFISDELARAEVDVQKKVITVTVWSKHLGKHNLDKLKNILKQYEKEGKFKMLLIID